MGLLYPFPTQEDPLDDRIEVGRGEITLKSYGLPLLFWGYLAALFSVLFFMFLATYKPLFKLMKTQDFFNQALGLSVLGLFILIPLSLLLFFFYEKIIEKKGQKLTLTHKLFWISCWKKTISLKNSQAFQVIPIRGTPNLAHLKGKPSPQSLSKPRLLPTHY